MTTLPATEDAPSRLIELARRGVDFGRRVAARLMRVPDPMLHSRRRRNAEAQLPDRIREVMVICYGNICRSPYAGYVLQRELADTSCVVRSSGFFGPNRRSPDTALAVSKQRGYDLDPHRSQLVTDESLASADLVVVMESKHLQQLRSEFGIDPRRIIFLGDFDPEPIAMRAIPDPYGRSPEVFDECYARIERCVRELGRVIRAKEKGGN
jgi:low molecular weight protein-tyrosine phosphatase